MSVPPSEFKCKLDAYVTENAQSEFRTSVDRQYKIAVPALIVWVE